LLTARLGEQKESVNFDSRESDSTPEALAYIKRNYRVANLP